jgi:hypothetical protein
MSLNPDLMGIVKGLPLGRVKARVEDRHGLGGKHGEYEIVLANPPCGKKSSDHHRQRSGRDLQGVAHHQPRRLAATAALRISLPLLLNALTRRQSGRARASPSRTGITAQLPPAHLHHPKAARHGTSPSVVGHGRAAVVLPDNIRHCATGNPLRARD